MSNETVCHAEMKQRGADYPGYHHCQCLRSVVSVVSDDQSSVHSQREASTMGVIIASASDQWSQWSQMFSPQTFTFWFREYIISHHKLN